jgi:trimethylamine--corrinoid protein Co-methyltransferase
MQPSIQMLAQGEIEHIDATSRRILDEVGILVENRDALELFQDAGAEVNFEKKLVKIPHDVITQDYCHGRIYSRRLRST